MTTRTFGLRAALLSCSIAPTWLTWTEAGVRKKEKLGGEATHGACLITW